MKKLTDRRKKILMFISECIANNNLPPTRRQIMKEIGIKGYYSVHRHIKILEDMGYLKVLPNTSRGLEVIKLDITNPNELRKSTCSEISNLFRNYYIKKGIFDYKQAKQMVNSLFVRKSINTMYNYFEQQAILNAKKYNAQRAATVASAVAAATSASMEKKKRVCGKILNTFLIK